MVWLRISYAKHAQDDTEWSFTKSPTSIMFFGIKLIEYHASFDDLLILWHFYSLTAYHCINLSIFMTRGRSMPLTHTAWVSLFPWTLHPHYIAWPPRVKCDAAVTNNCWARGNVLASPSILMCINTSVSVIIRCHEVWHRVSSVIIVITLKHYILTVIF